MEKCSPNFAQIGNFDFNTFKLRMKFCLRLLHRFKIIHKDIKPENILYSNCYKNYVLSDFGISHSIYEDLGTPSLTLK